MLSESPTLQWRIKWLTRLETRWITSDPCSDFTRRRWQLSPAKDLPLEHKTQSNSSSSDDKIVFHEIDNERTSEPWNTQKKIQKTLKLFELVKLTSESEVQIKLPRSGQISLLDRVFGYSKNLSKNLREKVVLNFRSLKSNWLSTLAVLRLETRVRLAGALRSS